MRYLFGDSSESDLEFDYLAFLREVIDCAVVMAECEVTLAVTVEGRRSRELETAAVISSVEELGRRVSDLLGPAGDPASTPVGRCAAAIAAAIRDAVDRESAQARGALAVECEEMDRQDQRQRARARGVLEKLLRTHDLPGAERTIEVVWGAAGVKATMRQRTGFGVEAVIALDVPASSILGNDLRVDKIAENVELHAHETAGWLKKTDKVVAHKLGRYQVASVGVAADATVVRLRASPEANAMGFTVTARRSGELVVEPTGGGPSREVAVDERNRAALRLLVEKLEAAARAAADNRAGLAAIDLDGVPIAEHAHPRVFAERLIAAVAPTVQRIAQRSRSPGELVLRRLITDNRREEIFVSTADLLKRLDGLPSHAREVFAPLQLGGEPPRPAVEEPRPSPRPTVDARPAGDRGATPLDRRFDTESELRSEPRPDARPPGRLGPPPAATPEGRSGPTRPPPSATTTTGEIRRLPRPVPPLAPPAPAPAPAAAAPLPRDEAPITDTPLFEDRSPPFGAPRADPTPIPLVRHASSEIRAAAAPPDAVADARKRADDALDEAIERALDEADTPPPR